MRKDAKSEATGLGLAFMFSQLGWVASNRFTKLISSIALTPPEAGLMRQLSSSPGITQQAFSKILKVVPSRMVVLVDSLEKKGLIERQRVEGDRRAYAITLTKAGENKLTALAKIMVRHELEFIAGLNPKEISALRNLCTKFRAIHGLSDSVHPAYKKLGDKDTKK